MLSIFPEAADFTAAGLWNGRKIGGFFAGLISRLGRAGVACFPLYNLMHGAAYLCRLSAQRFLFAFHP
jgi:hypothetical protein